VTAQVIGLAIWRILALADATLAALLIDMLDDILAYAAYPEFPAGGNPGLTTKEWTTRYTCGAVPSSWINRGLRSDCGRASVVDRPACPMPRLNS
jgi:hypothetical protein